jgi:Kef-type K+ transport system membrane component KefB
MIDIDSESFLAVVVAGALAAFLSGLVSSRLPLPVVVLEIIFGILIGPDVLGFAESDEFLNFFSNLGLGMLFFFAGYEIDFDRIRGHPLRLAVLGWLLSLVLAYSLGGLLTLTGLVLSLLFTGSALATTAIGTLIPVLSDAGELRTRFGTYLLAAGAVGEFGPILLITLVFSTKGAATNALILIAFVVVAVVAAVMAVRGVGRGWALLDRSLETSGQLAIRLAVVMVFALGALASSLGLDILLGGFVAGVIARLALKGREVEVLESKLTAVGYGFLIPFFFVVSGVNFDLTALTNDPIRLLELPLFLGLFLIVRGTPALVLYRGVLGLRDRAALAAFSATGLPLIVAITTIAVAEGHMRSSTAAALVGAGILSTAILPVVGLRLRAGAPKDDDPLQTQDGTAAAARA